MDVIKIKYGEKIKAPGIYDMPMGWYHADCCEGPSISSTGLRKIHTHSPAHYWATSIYNKDHVADEDETEATHFRIGRAAHTLLLEPEKARGMFVTRPGTFDSWRTKEAKDWRANAQREGKTVFDPAEWARVLGVAEALRGSAVHRDGVLDGPSEMSLVWKDKATGVWLKARPDAIPMSANILVDLKVMRDARSKAIHYAVRDYAYHMQMALAGVGMEKVLARVMEHYWLVCIESDVPHGSRVAPLDTMIKWGRVHLRKSLDIFATLLRQNDRWPSYEADDGEHIKFSDRDEEEFVIAQKNGLLPKKDQF